MNIFVLDENIETAAQYHLDKHVVKMPLETAQILCTVRHLFGGFAPYKATHKNHPCTVWCRESKSNYLWLCNFGLALCSEYSYRYGKIHACQSVIQDCLANIPAIPDVGLTSFALAMPEQYRSSDPVLSYRQYYIAEKRNIASWKKRGVPSWWN